MCSVLQAEAASRPSLRERRSALSTTVTEKTIKNPVATFFP